jgi:uncharacterized glyoxalase superfamily protein PhnB
MGAMPVSTPRTVVWPTFRYRDAERAITFLTEAFGFEEAVVYRSADGSRVDHAELRWPSGGGIMLGSLRETTDGINLAVATGSVYIVVDDPDAVYDRARAAGATLVREIRNEDHGSREFTVRDPEGVFWSFGTWPGADFAEHS